MKWRRTRNTILFKIRIRNHLICIISVSRMSATRQPNECGKMSANMNYGCKRMRIVVSLSSQRKNVSFQSQHSFICCLDCQQTSAALSIPLTTSPLTCQQFVSRLSADANLLAKVVSQPVTAVSR